MKDIIVNMKKLKLYAIVFATIISLAFGQPVFAVNTYSTNLVGASNQFWDIADGSQTGLDITGDMVLRFWIQLTTDATFEPISKYNSSGDQRAWLVELVGTPITDIKFAMTSDGTSGTYLQKGVTWNPDAGTWYYVAIVYDASAGEVAFFIGEGTADAVQVGSTQTGFPTSIFNSSAPLRIGAGNAAGGTLDGRFDDVRIYDVTQTLSQINADKNKEIEGTESNLQGYWKFENDALDETSNNNDLTNNNSATFVTDPAFSASSRRTIVTTIINN